MRAYDVIETVQDLRGLDWSESGQTSASGGTFLKARTGIGAHATYYKLSCYDSYRGIYGHECVNEVVASRLMDMLGVPHVRYTLVHATVHVDGVDHDTWLARSKSFRKSGESKMAFDTFFDLMHERGESQIDFCQRYGWLQGIQKMMLADYLIANRDRHGANIEVLRGKSGDLRLAPLFDNGVSLLFSYYGDIDRIRKFNPLEDVRANNFIGTRSLEANLRFVSPEIDIQPLNESSQRKLLSGLQSALPREHLDAIWNMVWARWLRWQDLRDDGGHAGEQAAGPARRSPDAK